MLQKEANLSAVKTEMSKARVVASAREHIVSADHEVFQVVGYGYIESTPPTSRFRVSCSLEFFSQVPRRKQRVSRPTDSQCVECGVESVDNVPIPDGDYLLALDDDGSHHLRKRSGQWLYIASS